MFPTQVTIFLPRSQRRAWCYPSIVQSFQPIRRALDYAGYDVSHRVGESLEAVGRVILELVQGISGKNVAHSSQAKCFRG